MLVDGRELGAPTQPARGLEMLQLAPSRKEQQTTAFSAVQAKHRGSRASGEPCYTAVPSELQWHLLCAPLPVQLQAWLEGAIWFFTLFPQPFSLGVPADSFNKLLHPRGTRAENSSSKTWESAIERGKLIIKAHIGAGFLSFCLKQNLNHFFLPPLWLW